MEEFPGLEPMGMNQVKAGPIDHKHHVFDIVLEVAAILENAQQYDPGEDKIRVIVVASGPREGDVLSEDHLWIDYAVAMYQWIAESEFNPLNVTPEILVVLMQLTGLSHETIIANVVKVYSLFEPIEKRLVEKGLIVVDKGDPIHKKMNPEGDKE